MGYSMVEPHAAPSMTIRELLREPYVVTDGAWGTRLQAAGLPIGACPDPWNAEHPDRVEEVASAYADAGSRILLTNTFRANRIAMQGTVWESSIDELNRRGVAISRRAAAGRALVFGSIGPSGKILMTGEVSADALGDAFREQAAALASAGADALVIETMSDLDEARIAVDAARSTELPVAVCMVFDSGTRHDRTMMGRTPEQCAEALTIAGADIVGANCGQGIEGFVEIGRRLRSATDRPIWIKANAGLPETNGHAMRYPGTPRQFADAVPSLIDAGVTFLGGCCGTTPEHITALGRSLAEYFRAA
ncbi:MAG: hypothetical protein FJ297_16555 [Planctomycetes bacterium]|nr:hypothetical protein [Planctomycetota bacterium]